MKTVEIKRFAGVRNDISPERFKFNEKDTGLTDLLNGSNVELDETGKPYRRLGTAQIDSSAVHSIWSDGDTFLCVRNGSLARMDKLLAFQDLSVPIKGTRVTYLRVGRDVFFTDGVQAGIIHDTNGYRVWGITPPSTPAVTVTAGDMLAGTYLVALTFMRDSGVESGASPMVAVTLGDNEGLSIELPTSLDLDVDYVRVYVTTCNGEVPLLAAEHPRSDTLSSIVSLPTAHTLPLRTAQYGAAPSGQLLGYYHGRIYVAENNYLWYSDPYEYELFKLTSNFIGFDSPVRTFAPVSDGLFVGSDAETLFLRGTDPSDFSVEVVANYGTLMGTEVFVKDHQLGDDAKTDASFWMSKQGLCMGLDGGEYKNLTGSRYMLPDGVSHGASLLKVRGGTPHIVTNLIQ